ncbi:inorganic phosphate transporter [Escherichia coli]|nr:inorganic phosphate transporter [Escherichia coli]EFB2897394.1 inorganic phosphate transporter [Escherichia coli]EFD0728210.1 inorganic phosphate transporter [Escherichia coli]EFD0760859.1 inorganic phosphate transporter [Escherichia coli]
MLNLFVGLDIYTGLLLLLALAFVLFYEAINGFHDTANAVAAVIYTRAMQPQLAVVMAAFFNFFGVLLGGLSVAYAIVHMLPTDLLLNMGSTHGLAMVFSMLLAAIIWNLGTWFFGLPASSSHTLIGAIIGIGLTNALLPSPQERRFAPFRESLGNAVSNGNRADFRKAIGHYARKASGGSSNAARRLGSVTQAGAELFGALVGMPSAPGEPSIDLGSLASLPCEIAISTIAQALTSQDGDSEKICAAMNHALVEALDGVEIFDPQKITDGVIVDTMIGYLAESIFLQMVMDSNRAWNKADTPSKAIHAEIELRELIKVVVDKHMAPKLAGNIRSFTRNQMVKIERQAIIEAWQEWEAYQ